VQLVETRSLNLSILLHAAAIIIAFVGLPIILPDTPEPTPLVMTVELLPITGVTNVKPSDQPIQKEQNAKTPPKPVKDPTAPEPMKPPPPKPVEKEKPVEKAEPKPDGFDINKDKPKEKEKEKPKDEPSDFEKLMQDLKKTPEAPKVEPKKAAPETPTKPGTDKTTTAENKTKSDAPYDPTMPMSLSEKDAIKGQIIPNWNAPAGVKDAQTLVVRVRVELQQDGSVKTAVLADGQQARYNSDAQFRAAADSAIRAVHKSSPLKNLPPDKYGMWKEFELNFDPKDII